MEFDTKLAERACAAISFNPELRAEQDRESCHAHLNDLRARLLPLAESGAQLDILAAELGTYKEGYIARLHAALQAKSRTMSPMITGPANFPVARNQARMATERKRYDELAEWSERAERAIKNKLLAARTPEQADDAGWQQVKRWIDRDMAFVFGYDRGEVPQYYNRSAFVNSVVGKIRREADNGNIALAQRALAYIAEQQAGVKKPFIAARDTIWQIAERTPQEPAPAATGEEEIAAPDGVRAVRNHDLDRLQLFFAGKPDEATRAALKSSGWNWSPTNGCWQRKITANAEYALARFLAAN